jgi:uncharacterized iron-regulated protein
VVPAILLAAVLSGSVDAQSPEHPVYDTQADLYISAQELTRRLVEADVIYVGETHTDTAHHQAQLEILRALRERNRAVVMGWEMFHSSQQPLLDSYIWGSLNEIEWLDAIYWEETWGHDYSHYKPLMDYAVEHQVRTFGLNAPRAVVSGVRADGEEGLSEELAWWLPAGFWNRITIESEIPYKEWFFLVARHDPSATDELMEGMFASQTAWNEIMAWNVVKVFNIIPDPDLQVLVIVGSGHAIFGQGIPTRVDLFRPGLRQVVVMPQTSDHVMTRSEIREQELELEGDYLWFVKPPGDPPKKR